MSKICPKATDCVLAITYSCNSRCEMCDIWKIKNYPEFSREEVKKLPTTLRDINISGGEPFLRKDLPDFIAEVVKTCPKARIVISSNGFATALIVEQMKKILAIKPDIGVAISIDGIGEMHNEIRGIPEGFNKDVATIKALQELGMKNLRVAFTVMEKNINHLSRVYQLSRDLGVEFAHSFAQSSDFYFGGKQNVNNPNRELLNKQYQFLIAEELKTWRIKNWLRAYFAYGMYKFITSKSPVLSNAPGRDFFFIDPDGIIYPSVVHNVPLANIREIKNFETFWCSEEMNEKRKQIDALKMPVWMICTSRTAMKSHPLNVFWWIFKNKVFGASL